MEYAYPFLMHKLHRQVGWIMKFPHKSGFYFYDDASQHHVALDINIYFSLHHRPFWNTSQVLKLLKVKLFKPPSLPCMFRPASAIIRCIKVGLGNFCAICAVAIGD
jgi:hypothetical protein